MTETRVTDAEIRIVDLYTAAEAALNNGQHLYSAELLNQALKIAESAGEGEVPASIAVALRRAVGFELRAAKRLREALAVLAPLSQINRAAIESCCAYGNMIDHIQIALRLPVSLATIERAYDQAENYFQ